MLVTTVAWLIPNILSLSHDLAVAGVVAAPVVVVAMAAATASTTLDAASILFLGDTRQVPSPSATHA